MFVICVAEMASNVRVKSCVTPSTSQRYAIERPSGDHAGARSLQPVVANGVYFNSRAADWDRCAPNHHPAPTATASKASVAVERIGPSFRRGGAAAADGCGTL